MIYLFDVLHMHILKASFRYTIYVFVNHEMGTLGARDMFNKKILKTLTQPNSSSSYLKYIVQIIVTIIDTLSR